MEPSLIVAGCVFPTPDPEMQRHWLAAVHTAARGDSAEVVGAVEPVMVGRSFARVVLRGSGGDSTTVMLNPAIRLVGAVSGDQSFIANAEYVTVAGAEIFLANGFAVADPLDLAASLSDRHLLSLKDEEAEQVRYHRPDRVGDVVFNWFD